MTRWTLVALALLSSGCRGYYTTTLPAPTSAPPVPGVEPALRAGLGRADITPPPGVGLYGYGPEGLEARGFRNRLWAKALVLEDAQGERLAFVVADLGVISAVLHRSVADRVAGETGIGADRLLLSATHTHAAAGHFIGVKQFDDYGSSVVGFDTVMVRFLAERISRAVLEAYGSLQPARVGYTMVPVWGFTRNRSLEAFERNPDSLKVYRPPPDLDLDDRQRAVDPTWTMLRVDVWDGAQSRYAPAGALSIFAMHGTAIPPVNDLFDGDVHGRVQRRLEEHIDSLNGRDRGFAAEAVHLLANGTVGDVSPDYPREGRCPPPKLRLGRRPGGPRTPPPAEVWRPTSSERVSSCMAVSQAYVDSAGLELANRVVMIFDSLADNLSSDVRLGRAFRTVRLKGELAPPGLCEEPRVGTATLVGSDNSQTRFEGWRLLGLIPVGFERGGSAADVGSEGCHAPKRVALGWLQGLIVGEHGLPEVVQLMVVRIGGLVVAAVPAEPTVGAGVLIKSAVRRYAVTAGVAAESIAVIGLANGDMRYVSTPDEYEEQDYEGSSTLYGPLTAVVLAHQLGELTAALSGAAGTAEARVDEIVAYSGRPRSVFPSSESGPTPERIERRIVESSCRGGTAVVRWLDTYPGRLLPADGPLLRVEQETSGGWEPYLWDDHSSLEIRALKPRGSRGYLWEMRWVAEVGLTGTYRVVLEPRDGLAALRGDPFDSCVGGPAGSSGDGRR